MTSEDNRLALLEATVAHHRELTEFRDRELDRRMGEMQTSILNIRTLIMRGLTWGGGGLLVAVCSLIWKHLGF